MIGIDLRFMSVNMKDGIISSGVGLFCADVLNGMDKDERNDVALIVDDRQKQAAEKLFGSYKTITCNFLGTERSRRILRPIDELRYDFLLKKNHIRCLWYPQATPYHYRHVSIPMISTIHDLITVHENPKDVWWKLGFRKIIRQSKHVVTISDYVKQDVMREFPGVAKKSIHVIPNPVTVNLNETEALPELEEKPFILDVNAYQNRKNAITLLKAYAKADLASHCELVFCGGYKAEGNFEFLKQRTKELGLEDHVHFYLSIPINQRNWLLKNAKMLVSPSLSEGFGRTPVEAALCQIPVITSTADSLVEVTQGMATYYGDPLNEEALSEALLDTYFHPPTKERLRQIADALRESYDPARIANEYVKIFKSMIRSKRE